MIFQLVNNFKIQFLRHRKPAFINAKAFRFILKILEIFQLANSFKANNFKLQTVSEAKISSKYYCVFSRESACK
jgi:hypothetical protein